MTGRGLHPEWGRGTCVTKSQTLILGPWTHPPGRAPVPSGPRCPSSDISASGPSPHPHPNSFTLSLSCIPLGADQGLNDTPDDSLLLIPTQRMGPLFSSPGGIAVPKAIPRVPDLTLLLAAPLHVPTPGAMGPAGDEVQRGHLGETGAPPTQAPGMKSPRWESRATLTFPGEPEALARPWWPEGLSPDVWEAQDLQPPPGPA